MTNLAKMVRKRMPIFSVFSICLHFGAVVCGDTTPWKETSEKPPTYVVAPPKNLRPDKTRFYDFQKENPPIRLSPTWRRDLKKLGHESFLASRREFLYDNELPRNAKSASVVLTSTSKREPDISNELPGDQENDKILKSWRNAINPDLRSTSTSTTEAAKTAASTAITSTKPATTKISEKISVTTKYPTEKMATKVTNVFGNLSNPIADHWRVRLAKLEKSRLLKRTSKRHKRPLKYSLKRKDRKLNSHQAKRRRSREKKPGYSKRRRKRRERRKTRSEKYNDAIKRKLGPEFVTLKSPRTTPTIVKNIRYRPMAHKENRYNAHVSRNRKYPPPKVTRRGQTQDTISSDMTTLTPFISSTRAFDYLSKYDSRPNPKRWPVNLILHEEIEQSHQTESPPKITKLFGLSKPSFATLTTAQSILSDMSTLTPFISSTRAFDYLSKYDSRAKQKRWPVNLGLNEEIDQIRHTESPIKTTKLSGLSKSSLASRTTAQSTVSDMSTLTPFISSTIAFDYLSKYDSRAKPKRWPVNLVLNEEIDQSRHTENPIKTTKLSGLSKSALASQTTTWSVLRTSSKSRSTNRQRNRRKKAWWRRKKKRQRSRGFKLRGKRWRKYKKRNKGKKNRTYRGITKKELLSPKSYYLRNLSHQYHINDTAFLTTANNSLYNFSRGNGDNVSPSNSFAHVREDGKTLHLYGNIESNVSTTSTSSGNLNTLRYFSTDNNSLSINKNGLADTSNETGIYLKKIKAENFLKIVSVSSHHLNFSRSNLTWNSENISSSLFNISNFMNASQVKLFHPENVSYSILTNSSFTDKSQVESIRVGIDKHKNINNTTKTLMYLNNTKQPDIKFSTQSNLFNSFNSTVPTPNRTNIYHKFMNEFDTKSNIFSNQTTLWNNLSKEQTIQNVSSNSSASFFIPSNMTQSPITSFSQTPSPIPSTTLSRPSFSRWRQWLNKKKKKKLKPTPETDGIRRGSMSDFVTTPTTTTTTKGPFITYKSAFDFIAQQKVIRGFHGNERIRESNEIHKHVSEKLCRIFNKRFVRTNIGGKCV